MRPQISIAEISSAQFRVTVTEGSSQTVHEVTVSPAELQRYAGSQSPAALVEASFQFLLQREPKEAILRKFALSEVERYFPDFPKVIRASY